MTVIAKNMEQQQDDLLKQFFATTYPDEEKEILNKLKSLNLNTLILKDFLNDTQKKEWMSLYYQKLNELQNHYQAAMAPNSFPWVISAFLAGFLIFIGVCAPVPMMIAVGVFFAIASSYLFADLFYKWFIQDNEKLESKYYADCTKLEEEHPHVVFSKKLITLMNYFNDNKESIKIDISSYPVNAESLPKIVSALESTDTVTVELPDKILFWNRFKLVEYDEIPEETHKDITSIKQKSLNIAMHNQFYGFFHNTACGAPNEIPAIPKDISKNIFGLFGKIQNLKCIETCPQIMQQK